MSRPNLRLVRSETVFAQIGRPTERHTAEDLAIFKRSRMSKLRASHSLIDDANDSDVMHACERFRSKFERKLTSTKRGREALASQGMSPDEALRAGL